MQESKHYKSRSKLFVSQATFLKNLVFLFTSAMVLSYSAASANVTGEELEVLQTQTQASLKSQKEQTRIIELNFDNFDQMVPQKLEDDSITESASLKPTFVKFYSPNCPHCIQMAPAWESLYDTLHPRISVAQIDCSNKENRQTCNEQKINGYPTLRLYLSSPSENLKAGLTSREDLAYTSYSYEGIREVPLMVQFLDHFLTDSLEARKMPEGAQGFEYFRWYARIAVLQTTEEIDFLFYGLGLFWVPPIVRYMSVLTIISLPIACLMMLLNMSEETQKSGFDPEVNDEQLMLEQLEDEIERRRKLGLVTNEQEEKLRIIYSKTKPDTSKINQIVNDKDKQD